MTDLFHQSNQSLWNHCVENHGLHLLESELFELWEVATRSCRAEIRRLERLVAFQMRGRAEDADERNKVISLKNAQIMEFLDRASKFEEALRKILAYPVHSEPVGGAYAMQDIAYEALGEKA